MASEGKTVGKPHFQHQDKANTQSRIMIANHAARSSKKVGLAREHGSMKASRKEVQNIQGMLNNQMDGVSKHQHNDLQGTTRKSKFFRKSHFQLQDEEDTQECQNIQGMLNNQMDKVSKQQHNDVQGMALKNKNVGKTHFQLQDETNTQPLILIDNHTTRNSKERDCQSIQGASRNQIDEASNQNDIELQGLTSRITFNNNPHVENDSMDEESDQDVDSESESLDAEKKTRGPTFMKKFGVDLARCHVLRFDVMIWDVLLDQEEINLLNFWVLWQEMVNFVRLTWKIGIKCPWIVRKKC
ncbi:uncharacterized protein LOC142531582 isoform X3 [Primulina tabacum]|uniref:uncharacterized protein LOC142531582 isoform X3 n=1 Tax=Primulina tabacum TaxID=48773 RepID=UPI003F5ABF0E